jgi:hypothetical protein
MGLIASTPAQRALRHKIRLVIGWICIPIGVILFVIGMHLAGPGDVNQLANGNSVGQGEIDWGVVLFLGPPALWLWGVIWRFVSKIFDQATADIPPPPSPAEVQARLRIELHREPTLTEVAAVHQMLVSDTQLRTQMRNQALIGLGALVVGSALVEHNLHR